MFTGITIGIVFLLVLVLMFVGRRVLRLAIKLAIAGVLILLLFVGVGLAWWQGWFDSKPRSPRQMSQTNQPRNRTSPR